MHLVDLVSEQFLLRIFSFRKVISAVMLVIWICIKKKILNIKITKISFSWVLFNMFVEVLRILKNTTFRNEVLILWMKWFFITFFNCQSSRYLFIMGTLILFKHSFQTFRRKYHKSAYFFNWSLYYLSYKGIRS